MRVLPLQTAEGKVVGAVCRDTLSGEETRVYARVVVNATGPYVDSVRRMSDAKAPPVITPSAGAHITLPSYYAPGDVGLIIPKTKVQKKRLEGLHCATLNISHNQLLQPPPPASSPPAAHQQSYNMWRPAAHPSLPAAAPPARLTACPPKPHYRTCHLAP